MVEAGPVGNPPPMKKGTPTNTPPAPKVDVGMGSVIIRVVRGDNTSTTSAIGVQISQDPTPYRRIILLADSNNSVNVMIGGDQTNPPFPLAAGQSVDLNDPDPRVRYRLCDIFYASAVSGTSITLHILTA